MKIELRLANRTDVPALQQMAERSYHQHFTYLWTPEGLQAYLEHYYDLKTFYDFIEASDRQVYLAFYRGQIAGYLVVQTQKNWKDQSSGCYIHRIYLLSEFAGQGIGSLLMGKAEELARLSASNYLWLEVMQSSINSIAFYQKKGFEIVSLSYFDILPMKTEALAEMWIMQKRFI
ncbi:MAG: GNAT family N-acetyltransferase [Saprospiraceae bacterium]|nr:GNAT family N-acetyltransferase [Saprospiraceae bacterium]